MFKSYASGSSGNFYEVNDGETRIAIECGLPFKKIQALCGHQTAQYAAFLVSHEHQDHAKAVPKLVERGIPVYLSEGTAKALKVDGHSVHVIPPLLVQKIGSFIVKPFPTEHDAREPFGFLLLSAATGKKLLFATDTKCIRYRFKGIHEIAIECNYSEEMLGEADLPDVVKKRITRSHMSLEAVKEFLRQTDLRDTERIHLLHLSANNSRADFFQQEIQRLTGKEVYVC